MPSGTPQTAYPSLSVVLSLVRSLLNDPAGNVFTDAVLLPYANSAFRKVNAALGNVQAASYIKETQLVLPATTISDPGVQTYLTDAGYNNGTSNFTVYGGLPLQLPPDLLVPLKLWERHNGQTQDYIEMVDLTDGGGLPSQPQAQNLQFFEWRSDGIYFLGATVDIQIRLRYEAAFMDMADGTAPLPIRYGQNAVAFQTAMLAAAARGAPETAVWKDGFDEAIESTKNRAAMREQNKVRRRRPFSSRSNSYPFL